AIPSWGVLVASNAVNKEDVGRNGIDSIRNAPGMRHQNVQGTLEERARGPGVAP
ncbi:simA domain protein, partial [Escherichia coli]|nr:simA domain protein [Escherichia coli]